LLYSQSADKTNTRLLIGKDFYGSIPSSNLLILNLSRELVVLTLFLMRRRKVKRRKSLFNFFLFNKVYASLFPYSGGIVTFFSRLTQFAEITGYNPTISSSTVNWYTFTLQPWYNSPLQLRHKQPAGEFH